MAIDKYLATTGDRIDRGLLKAILLRDDFRFATEPVGVEKVAGLMHRVGLLRRPIDHWRDRFIMPL